MNRRSRSYRTPRYAQLLKWCNLHTHNNAGPIHYSYLSHYTVLDAKSTFESTIATVRRDSSRCCRELESRRLTRVVGLIKHAGSNLSYLTGGRLPRVPDMWCQTALGSLKHDCEVASLITPLLYAFLIVPCKDTTDIAIDLERAAFNFKDVWKITCTYGPT